jgi:tetratricopeptide (TPR) repeat protein
MKKSIPNFLIVILFPLVVHAQLQPGDEHWRQFTQIQEGRYVASVSHNGTLYVCFVGETPLTAYSYKIFELTESGVKQYSQLNITGESGGSNAQITTIAFFNNELVVAGNFQRVNDVLANGCARWDGQKWRSLGLGIEGIVLGCITSEKEIFFHGLFSKAGGQPARSFVKWDGSTWTVLADINCDQVKLDYRQPIYNDWYNIGQLTYLDNFIYAVGAVMNPLQGRDYVSECKESKFFPGIVRYSISENRWEQVFPVQKPSRETPKIYGISSFFIVGKSIYMAGSFGTTNGISIQKFDDNKWTSLGTLQGQGFVESMTYLNNTLYIGGTFTGISNVEAHNVAKWDGSNWKSLGSGLSGGLKGEVQFDKKPGGNSVTYNYTDVVKSIYPINNSLLVLGNFNKAGSLSSKYAALWNESVSIEKPNSNTLLESTKAKVQAGDLNNALKDITTAVEQNPKDPQLLLYRGWVYTCLLEDDFKEKGDYNWALWDKANNDFGAVIGLQPENSKAYFFRGYIGYLLCTINPRNSHVKNDIATDFETAIQLDQQDARSYFYLGLYYMLYDNPSEKTVDCFLDARKYYQEKESKELSTFNLAVYYYKKGDNHKVISYINEFLKDNTEQQWYLARRYRGQSMFNINDYDGALKDFNDILVKFPNDKAVADIYRMRAKILFKKSGNFNDACPDMKKASELGDYDAKQFMEEVCK